MNWWKDALERVVSTVAETALAMLPISAMITEIDWRTVALTSAYAGALALLKALAKTRISK